MTIGLHESIDGPVVLRLRDHGDGIRCEILEIQGRWAKIETTDGRRGYINFDEPVAAIAPLQ